MFSVEEFFVFGAAFFDHPFPLLLRTRFDPLDQAILWNEHPFPNMQSREILLPHEGVGIGTRYAEHSGPTPSVGEQQIFYKNINSFAENSISKDFAFDNELVFNISSKDKAQPSNVKELLRCHL